MNWLRKLSIGNRLIAGFCAVIFLGVAGYAYAFLSERRSAQISNRLEGAINRSLHASRDATLASHDTAFNALGYVYTKDPSYADAYRKTHAAAIRDYAALRKDVTSLPRHEALLSKLDALVQVDEDVCARFQESAIRLTAAGSQQEARRLIERQYSAARKRLDMDNSLFLDSLIKYRSLTLVSSRRQVHRAIAVGWIIQAFTLAVSLGIALFISRSIASNLRKLVNAEREMRRSEERFRSLVRNASDVTAICAPSGEIQYLSSASKQHFGYDASEFIGKPFFDFIHREDQARAATLFAEAAATPAANLVSELRLSHRDGSWRPAEIHLHNLIDDPSIDGIALSYRDITERKAFEQELAHRAFHDILTGLPNRALFLNRLENALARARRQQNVVGVMFVDVDNFKLVNDSLSHQAGDTLLTAVSERLQACLRGGDTVARVGGDEFTILLENIGDAQDVSLFAERIAHQLQQPIHVQERDLYVTVSIGIALSASAEENAEDLLRDADVAMVHAKHSGKANHALFERGMNEQAMERLELEALLHRALAEDQMRVYYQPIIELSTREITKFEALVRWRHPQLGLVPPLKFIPLAEENGVIGPLGQWVLRQACLQCREWQQATPGREKLGIAVNLSARQLQLPGLARQVAQALEESGLAPQCLELEITESVMMGDPETAIRTLQELKALGIQIAVDDFGTGYSSMAYLSRFPIDTLKIDRSFIQKMNDPEGFAIVHAIVNLSKSLGLRIISEGIETDEQLTQLQLLECHFGQGFLISAPVPADAAGVMLNPASKTNAVSP